jgi:hypothetical protein
MVHYIPPPPYLCVVLGASIDYVQTKFFKIMQKKFGSSCPIWAPTEPRNHPRDPTSSYPKLA